MRALRGDLSVSLRAVLALTLVCGVAYPLILTGISQVAFPGNANGQQVFAGGRLVGSKIIGQSFGGQRRYFQTRPSGTTPADDGAATAFADYGPNSTVTVKALNANIAAYVRLNGRYVPGGLAPAKVPVDAADTSASGVDPQISVANADIQAHRVAAVRGLPLAAVQRLIARYTSGRGLGFAGDPAVNVLELNLALDRLRPHGSR